MSVNRKLRLLWICSANLNRSPTFELWYNENHPEFESRSSGCWHGYPDRIDQKLLDWADWIFVMDISHEMHLRHFYPSIIDKLRVVGVSDQYDWNQQELKDIIAYWYEFHFKEITGDGVHLPSCEHTMCSCVNRLKEEEDL